MPLRNLTILLATAFFSLVCYAEANRNRYAGILSEAIEKVAEYYVEPVDTRALFEGGLRGMLNELDPYSGYIAPQDYSEFMVEIEQHFGGIGVEVGVEDDQLTVLNPIPGSPAYEAGVLAGDVIVEIDGEDVRGASLDEAVKKMRGPIGEAVKVKIERKGETVPRELRIVRDDIRVESVRGDWRDLRGQWHFQLAQDERLGYVRLNSFGDRTAEDLHASLQQLEGKVDGIILDLRGNAGGLLSSAIQVCDMFLPADQVVVSTRGRDGVIGNVYRSSTPPLVSPKLPVVVLVDRFSASASEIVAACLQDYDRAVIVGERTWGKGTVQNVISIEGGRSAIRLTTQTYWRPSGVNIHRHADDEPTDTWGVQPDAENRVEFTIDEYQNVYEARRKRDYPADSPPPLTTAGTPEPGTVSQPTDDQTAPELTGQNAPDQASNEAEATSDPAAVESVDRSSPSPSPSPSPSAEAPQPEATAGVDGEKSSESANRPLDRQLQRAVEVLRARIQSAGTTR